MFGIISVALVCTILVETKNIELYPFTDEFIDEINSKQSSWKAGRNFAEDFSMESFKMLMGLKESEKLSDDLEVHYHPAEKLENLPEEFDPRTKWPNCSSLNDIRDQGSCGSCWAISAAAAMTDRYCIFSNETKQFHFSTDDILTCNDVEDSCKGGSIETAWNFWVSKGVVSGGEYNSTKGCKPYRIPPCDHNIIQKDMTLPKCSSEGIVTPSCETKCIPEHGTPFSQDKRYGEKLYGIPPDEEQVKAELYHHGPVEGGFRVFTDFGNYKSGVYRHTSGEEVGKHAVKIIGWGIENDMKYWLVANSWNKDWAEYNGFFKILRGDNHLGIENSIVAGIPKIED